MKEDVISRLRRLEDREEIRALAARYTFAVDNRDLESIESLFHAEASFRSIDGVMNAVGRPAIMEQFKRRFAVLGHGAHYSHDHHIWFEAGEDVAFALLSAHAELIRNGAPMVAALRYQDRYVRDAGRWVFADRLLSFLYYLRADEYVGGFGDRLRVRAYDTPKEADFPEMLPTWRDYYSID